ncbi:MAG: type III toxin-antitoxin system ToxN/AbiQ family toxin [Enterococcus cecorum]|nr:type III toxin-antitoxin system ToxN/AbiQ family toxin [Enterococcus cecorum]
MPNLMNFFSLDDASYHLLETKTGNEILYNKSEHRPYGVIMSVGNVDYYVPMKHDLNVTSKPFLETSVYLIPSQTLNYPYGGFDFQHVLPIKDGAYSFTLNNQLIANDQRTLATNMQNQIASKLEKYVKNYKHYQRGENLELVDGKLPDTRTFKVSTLNYFHEEIGLEPIFDIQHIIDKFSREGHLSLVENYPYVHYMNEAEISDAEDIQFVLNVFSEKEQDEILDQSPWNLELMKGGKSLGYLAYGDSWSTEFEIQDELEDLKNRVRQNDYKNLYSEIDFKDLLKDSGFELDNELENEKAMKLQKYLGQIPFVHKGNLQEMDNLLAEEQVYSRSFRDIDIAKNDGFEIMEEEFTPNKIYYYKNEEEEKVIQFASENPKEIAKYFELMLKSQSNVTYDFTKIDKDFGRDDMKTESVLSTIRKIVRMKDINQKNIEKENEMER